MKKRARPIYVLGINGSHGATAALLRDGEIIACAMEERFNRKKNYAGYPAFAITYCLQFAKITSDDLTSVCIGFRNPSLFVGEESYSKSNVENFFSIFRPVVIRFTIFLIGKLPFLYDFYDSLSNSIYTLFFYSYFAKKQKQFLADKLNLSVEKIHFVDHHYAHSYAAYYSSPIKRRRSLVLTCDGMGDLASSRVFTVESDSWQEIASTPRKYTLGWLYENVTSFLGMKPREHESKVMGLAPYAHMSDVQKVTPFLEKLLWVENMSLKSSLPMFSYVYYIEKHFRRVRFDIVAGAIQLFTENVLTKLVKTCLDITNTREVMFGGGVFMNVKANMQIGKLNKVDNMFIMPSAGDESTAIGAAYFGYRTGCIKEAKEYQLKPLTHLYLGPAFSSGQIYQEIRKFTRRQKGVRVERLSNPGQTVAELLVKGNIVARFSGRMEYGARALGNRSILAHPSRKEVIRIINDQIKGRDFWMPFAPTILADKASEYLLNPKRLDSPFMMLAFETTQLAHEHLAACMHPYDKTVRPQLLDENQNPLYYALVTCFEQLTGISAVLNTSFNLHGEPIVCTPEDALSTFKRSGLQYLLLEDYLLTKLI